MMNPSLAQEPFTATEFAAGGVAVATVVLIASLGLSLSRPQELSPAPVAPPPAPATSNASSGSGQWHRGSKSAARAPSGLPASNNGVEPASPPSSVLPDASNTPVPYPSEATPPGLPIADAPVAPASGGLRGALRIEDAPPPQPQSQTREAAVVPSLGAERTPINRSYAYLIQTRLHELGYYFGNGNGVWGPASRNALRDFKSMNGLQDDDRWDKETEQRLWSRHGIQAVSTFIGGWAVDIGQCQQPRGGGAPLIAISSRGAETAGGKCDFRSVARETASRWRIQAVCSGEGRSWTANISLKLSGQTLTWSSERGAARYVRCLKP